MWLLLQPGVGEGVTPLTSSHSRRRAPLPPAALKSLEHAARRTSNFGCSNFCINSLSLSPGELWPREFLAVAPITLADWIWPLVCGVGGDASARQEAQNYTSSDERAKIIRPLWKMPRKHLLRIVNGKISCCLMRNCDWRRQRYNLDARLLLRQRQMILNSPESCQFEVLKKTRALRKVGISARGDGTKRRFPPRALLSARRTLAPCNLTRRTNKKAAGEKRE